MESLRIDPQMNGLLEKMMEIEKLGDEIITSKAQVEDGARLK